MITNLAWPDPLLFKLQFLFITKLAFSPQLTQVLYYFRFSMFILLEYSKPILMQIRYFAKQGHYLFL